MDPAAPERPVRGIAGPIDRDFGGRITKEHMAVLCVGGRKD
jgi:hypothetical protein